MKKTILLFVALAAVVVFTVPGVLATTESTGSQQIDPINQEILDLRMELVDRYLESGQLTEEQATLMKEQFIAAAIASSTQPQSRGFGRGCCATGGAADGGATAGVARGCCGTSGNSGLERADCCEIGSENANSPTISIPGL
ncbi:DUF2680 domain-containing protein [Desulfuribacillus alkaliarsenatis]|uniref:DUF2680 domain-containing protein n=1 Tax=Desulfuribacillus alkaliarsenatis TaxID=766136 RepID=A0A1E5G3J2_9FIRM|nr:DUF2680 domain-containing protein [Desulfuribacillus alkaliarsenatis]OEF97624.1 hypothetical protein BHF68_14610 [Desulfuribacillus alkaliarsenatis]